jgi:hypothetical protein
MTTMSGPQLLRESAVSKEYGFGRAWLKKRRWLRLPPAFIRVERAVFYRRSDLDEFIELCKVKPSSVEPK